MEIVKSSPKQALEYKLVLLKENQLTKENLGDDPKNSWNKSDTILQLQERGTTE